MLRVAAVVGFVSLSSLAQAGSHGAMAIPPLRIDLGSTAPIADDALVGPSSDFLVGMHWASLAWKPTRIDIGVGYVSSTRPLFDPPAPRSISRMRWPTDDEHVLRGMYLALGHTLTHSRHVRTWFEARGELLRSTLHDRTSSSLGGALRVSAELYGSGVVGDRGVRSLLLAIGSVGVGVYLEASHREVAPGLGGTGVSGGVSIRLPFAVAAAY